ncbi:MAG: ATP-binding cassette subfamily B protein [Flammeovirgaceae bacterium]|jgi:ATP-binding cassette subfamily B protein
MAIKKFTHYTQLDQMDCGPTCLKMVAKHYGKELSIQYLREEAHIDRQGVSLLGIADAAEKVGFRTMAVKTNFETLVEEAPFPCIAHWNQQHFVVVYRIETDKVYVADPANALLVYTKEEFCKSWIGKGQDDEGILLLLETTPEFHAEEFMGELPEKTSFRFLFQYLTPYKKLIFQVFLGLLAGSVLALVLPFLTQALVDFGINKQDIGFVYTVLVAQVALFFGKTAIEVIRSWILLHISARVNIFIISDFLIKLMKLPISFFDSKNLGDILQRMQDHERIKHFLTSSSLSFLFSVVSFLIFSVVLLIYSVEIFIIFLVGSALYVSWILFFMKRRRELDFKRFNQASSNQSNEVQLVQGMQEIKLNNCEKQKRWEWEGIQVKLFKISLSSLALAQYQNAGGGFLNELKNILITFWAAKEVIDGNMTLGMMLATQQILGQLNAPVLQFVTFIQEAQDAKISLERLGEIHNKPDEDEQTTTAMLIPENKDLKLQNVDFRYGDPNADFVLEKLSLTIPHGKTTAIVGASGSGKTTLLKLLLKFYDPESGEIKLGETPLKSLDSKLWRAKVGSVMQDGFIFSDSIARNIALGEETINTEQLLFACEVANIRSFIEELPLNYNTKIGGDGIGLSQGQKQRVMIARAVYKNPDYLFFDEATSALDANNEKEITQKIEAFTQNKTVIVIAHRLSTVKNADQIIVLDKGKIAEIGTHKDLVKQKGLYFELVKNQLELGN